MLCRPSPQSTVHPLTVPASGPAADRATPAFAPAGPPRGSVATTPKAGATYWTATGTDAVAGALPAVPPPSSVTVSVGV